MFLLFAGVIKMYKMVIKQLGGKRVSPQRMLQDKSSEMPAKEDRNNEFAAELHVMKDGYRASQRKFNMN